MTIDEKKKILALHQQGLTISKIIEITGYSRATISRFLNSYNEEDLVDKLIGQKFNRLTVIKQVESKNNKTQYLCRCDCGKTTIVQRGHLVSGHTKSCGCLKYNINDGENLIGQKFGRLTPIKKIKKNDIVLWECQCDCGNIHYARTGDLINSRVKSCGCLYSYGEEQIKQLLNKFNIEYQQQYQFKDLLGNSRPLRFDFAIFLNQQLSCLIEYQGEYHYNKNSPWHGDKTILYDEKKREYCKLNNIPLYELNKNHNLEKELLIILEERGILNG